MNNRLRAVRYDGRRISQFRLTQLTGINSTKMSFIENQLIEATPEEKKKIAKALGVSVEEIWPDKDILAATGEK